MHLFLDQENFSFLWTVLPFYFLALELSSMLVSFCHFVFRPFFDVFVLCFFFRPVLSSRFPLCTCVSLDLSSTCSF